MSCFVQLKENCIVPTFLGQIYPDPKAAGLCVERNWLLGSAYRDAGAQHDETIEDDLENRLQERSVHVA